MSIGDGYPGAMEANTELMNALKTLLEVGKYSDLTIVCREKTYAVHRAIICSRSGFFDGACSSPFREAITGVIDLSEDEPEAVEHMVNYFYSLDYLSPSRSKRTSLPMSPVANSPSSPIFSRAPRKKLNLAFVEDPLLATAAANVDSVTSPGFPQYSPAMASPDSVAPLASPFATDFSANMKLPFPTSPDEELDASNWDVRSTSSQDADMEVPHLITHARVYAIAEKYGISGLKTLARRKFASQVAHHYPSAEFAEVLQEVYESTMDSDRGLRDIVIQTFRSHPDIVTRRDVEMVVKETPELAWELFRVGWGLPIRS